jgi:serine/threonine protein kinase
MAEVPTKSLERYDVLDRIAVGGMAEVFLAKAYGAHGFEKTLAIKRILPELARDPEFEDRFIAEAKLAVKLSHTNVVQVFDFGRFAGSLFIAMEFVDGLDLAALLRRHRDAGTQLPVPAAFHIGVELARGLDFAHLHGVIHRDVSPSNILLSRAGEVKIADFGIAVAARMERPRPGAKRKVMGKWRYMSPEQARGEPLDARSDIFSLAVVLYELFTGEKLFPGDEVEEIVRNINDMDLPRPSEIRRELPKRVDDILMPALSREPSRRPLRASILQRAITELSYESSIVATAIDVADAVASALEIALPSPSTSGKHSLDSIIRAQLVENIGKEGQTGRRTALTTDQHPTAITASKLHRDRGEPLVITREAMILGASDAGRTDAYADTADAEDRGRITEPVQLEALGDEGTGRAILERRIDPDGITHLELETTVAGGRRRPATGDVPELPAPGTEPATPGPPRPRRARLAPAAAVAAVVVALGAGGVWLASRGGGATAAAAVDAAVIGAVADGGVDAAATAVLDITSEPAGVAGRVGGVLVSDN